VSENTILIKSKAFAIRIIKLYKHLTDESHEYVLSKQILRSGTSIGANAREAVRGSSRKDFAAKMNIALKEADETAYWLELLVETDYLTQSQFNSIYTDCDEIIRLLAAIVKSAKAPHS
jgi:four helix bundle protein